MFKLIVLALAAYFIYRLFANDFFKKRKERELKEQEEVRNKAASGEMVQDPECGTYVEKESSISVREGSKQYYFCSYECRDKFLARLDKGRSVLETKHRD